MKRLLRSEHTKVFGFFCVVLFLLYLPAARAGMVSDFPKWLESIRTQSFHDYINNADTSSLYQLTQFTTYVFYKLFGTNPWLWHLLQLTMHAINCLLLFIFFSRLLTVSAIKGARIIAFGGVFLFCISPYNTEVVVHEPCYHYLQGMLLVMLILLWVQKFYLRQQIKYAWYAAILFYLSTWSLELFYVVPAFVFTLALYYLFTFADRKAFRRVMLLFFLPQVLIFIVYLITLRMVSHVLLAHTGFAGNAATYCSRFPDYLFHIVLLGRSFPVDIRQAVYAFCSTTAFLTVFYSLLIMACIFILLRFRKMEAKGKATALFFVWVLFSVIIVLPQDFPVIQYVSFDRYCYFMEPFIYIVLVLLLSRLRYSIVSIGILAVYSLVNMYYLDKINKYWGTSAKVVDSLVAGFPNTGNKDIVLLNLPENMDGALMIGSRGESLFKLTYNNLGRGKRITSAVYDIASYNMNTAGDGVHATVINDSTVRVTFNQSGNWWWFHYLGAGNRENDVYKVVFDGGSYDLTMRQPPINFAILFTTGGEWRTLDWSKKGVDQY